MSSTVSGTEQPLTVWVPSSLVNLFPVSLLQFSHYIHVLDQVILLPTLYGFANIYWTNSKFEDVAE